jgi:hypothetical protein
MSRTSVQAAIRKAMQTGRKCDSKQLTPAEAKRIVASANKDGELDAGEREELTQLEINARPQPKRGAPCMKLSGDHFYATAAALKPIRAALAGGGNGAKFSYKPNVTHAMFMNAMAAAIPGHLPEHHLHLSLQFQRGAEPQFTTKVDNKKRTVTIALDATSPTELLNRALELRDIQVPLDNLTQVGQSYSFQVRYASGTGEVLSAGQFTPMPPAGGHDHNGHDHGGHDHPHH